MVQSKCPSYVGATGIILQVAQVYLSEISKETCGTFVIITTDNMVKGLTCLSFSCFSHPKELHYICNKSWFRKQSNNTSWEALLAGNHSSEVFQLFQTPAKASAKKFKRQNTIEIL